DVIRDSSVTGVQTCALPICDVEDVEVADVAALKGKIFRIGHIGYFDVFDITTALAAVELVLADLGAEIERGVAVTRALEAYEERSEERREGDEGGHEREEKR